VAKLPIIPWVTHEDIPAEVHIRTAMETNGPVIFDSDPSREILLIARREVQQMLRAPEEPTNVSLFLPTHYPFFDKVVQSVLRERHPAQWRGMINYAVDAYLWAEQYGWIAYSDFPLRSPVSIEDHASFYFTYDLRWFSRLLTAVANSIESTLRVKTVEVPRATLLQAWVNSFSDIEKRPSLWLEGTRMVENARKGSQSNPENQRNSIRVSAAKLNRARRKLFAQWQPCWEAELRHLDVLLKPRKPTVCRLL